ncbi:MAG: T9SS type A sorting domain-containing protein [Mariniphaga sp.]|nr:T9SS type A sorting domain-containing protein [Mariniphaga sp.]
MNTKLLKLTLLIFLAFPLLGRAQYPSGIITGKFSPSGKLLWERNITQGGIAYGNCIDNEANIYIVGDNRGGFQLDDYLIYDGKFVAKYDSTGELKWVKGIYGYSTNIRGVAADSNGNCYVLGWVHGYIIADTFMLEGAKQYLYIIKYNKTGDVQWINTILGRDYYIRAGGISINEKNNRIYVTAIEDKEFRVIYSDSAKHILASYDLQNCKPIKEIAIINHVGYPFGALNTVRGITNHEASVYVTGTIKNKKGNDNIYIAKLDTGLNVVWEKQTESSFVRNIGYDIMLDNDKNIYVTGIYSDTVWFDNDILIADQYAHDLFVAKLNGDGDFIWVKRAGASDKYEFGYSICSDFNNNIYISGFMGERVEFSPTIKTEEEGSFFAKLNEDGDVLFERSYYTGYEHDGEFSACYVDCDDSGNLCFTASHLNSLSLGTRLLKQGLNLLVNVYPNPCRGTLNTRYISGVAGEIGLQVYNYLGQEVFAAKRNTTPGNNNYKLDLSALQPGMYFLSISKGQKTVATNKFIIEQ